MNRFMNILKVMTYKQVGLLGFALAALLLGGCAWINQGIESTEAAVSALNRPKSCETQSQVSGQGYYRQQSYRCVGNDCQQYGCGQAATY